MITYNKIEELYLEYISPRVTTNDEIDMLRDLYWAMSEEDALYSTDLKIDWPEVCRKWEMGKTPKGQKDVYFNLTIPRVKSDEILDLINLARAIGEPFDISIDEPMDYTIKETSK